MTNDQIRDLVWKVAQPSWREWCRVKSVSISHLSEFMSGKRAQPSTDLLNALDLEWKIMPKTTACPFCTGLSTYSGDECQTFCQRHYRLYRMTGAQ